MLKKVAVKDILLSAGQKDIHNQLWNINEPVSSHENPMEVQRTLRYFKNANFIMDALYDSRDSEYKDIKYTEELLNNVLKEDMN